MLKVGIVAETKAWKVLFGRRMNSEYSATMESILDQIEEISKQLSRPIKDLDDVRTAMGALKEIRENEIRIDMALGPIEVSFTTSTLFPLFYCFNYYFICILQESYTLLTKFQIQVQREEAERVDTLRYSWQKLQVLSVSILSVNYTG